MFAAQRRVGVVGVVAIGTVPLRGGVDRVVVHGDEMDVAPAGGNGDGGDRACLVAVAVPDAHAQQVTVEAKRLLEVGDADRDVVDADDVE
ncbi:hypothetical protein JCM17823_00050 [Halorubrum gandharaense]